MLGPYHESRGLDRVWICRTVDAEMSDRGLELLGYGIRVKSLLRSYEHDTQELICFTEAAQDRDVWHLVQSIGLSQATHQELQTHRDHVYAHETHLQAHQTQLQLQGTLIQTQHQVHETRFPMQQAELAALRETNRRRQAQKPGPETRIPDHQDASGDADSHI
ncbi:hypothetical protein Tco_0579550 [Tanacetum coccineum]